MSLSRRKFSRELKLAAVRRLEMGASPGEVARACEVNPNVLHRWRREFRHGVERAFPLWVADITYIRLETEFVYLAVILDAFSRRVVGWALD